MNLSRREFLQMLLAAGLTGAGASPQKSYAVNSLEQISPQLNKLNADDLYNLPPFGNVSLMHFTDCHAQLLPAYYREPNMHIGFGNEHVDALPHIVGKYFLDQFNIEYRSPQAYALTFLDFAELAAKYGRTGGFAHLATLVKRLREQRPGSLLLDGGDTWQGTATSLWSEGQDMIDAALLLGVDVMTGHWEFTYGMDRIKHVIDNDFKDKIDFVAQNVVDNEFEDPVFKAYVLKEINGVQVAVIGQAFPYTPVSHPRYLVADWQFGIHEERLQKNINLARDDGAQVVALLSHNGMDVDLKMASRISGIDIILGGHTHDAIPTAIEVNNSGGKTIVINSGTNGKFLSVLDLNVKNGKLTDYRFALLPVFSNLLEPDTQMQMHIDNIRKPHLQKLNEELAITNDLLYRRGTFNGSFDQLIVNALMSTQQAEIAFSPGFRWGTTLLPGSAITFEDVMAQTAITYPIVTRREMSGQQIKAVLEDLADNRFSHDPYHQQGGDMVRVGGLQYTLNPSAQLGQRIQNLSLNGALIDASRKYVVAGWASVEKLTEGKAIWDVVAEYLRDKKQVSIKDINIPQLSANITNSKSVQIV